MTIPGVGPVTASAIRATIQDAGAFASGREFAAFLGLDTAPELDRRQNAARAHHKDGRDRYLAQASGGGAPARRCAIAEAIATPCVYGRADARAQDGQIQVQSDRGGARQQGRAHRLRADDEGRPVRRSAGRSVNERGYSIGSFSPPRRSTSRAPTK